MMVYVPDDVDVEFLIVKQRTEVSACNIRDYDGVIIDQYRETDCPLGFIFSQKPVFEVKRHSPAGTEGGLDVFLSCGYAEQSENKDWCQREEGGELPVADIKNQKYRVELLSGQDSTYFSPWSTESSESTPNKETLFRCRIDCIEPKTSIGEKGFAEQVVLSKPNISGDSFLSEVEDFYDSGDIPHSLDDRIVQIENSIFFTYLIGHHAGFIKMPMNSMVELQSSSPPADVPINEYMEKQRSLLLQHETLGSLFANSDSMLQTTNFGMRTPNEARVLYREMYEDRFERYFGETLGRFLKLVSK